ncbi:ATP-binding cassette subfamily B protein [Streptosporangium becharense]|uniref:ATP-binding cassette subfamily B protein n=1 Tax=Streptosporangium becharense TaxID=1816182 RepID=A0A7W9MFB3_9ACTN|nr:ABC transporter ATP-binding protein [Streptosporangium becharense]MBB2912073.1 ATP-binding cassette subfamily B protein [Streptosporangium becharense]MBB5818620.1 ATP-binding cassette subfamily B protein [Streptosporangium becharense]
MADETAVTDNEVTPRQHGEELTFNFSGGDTAELARHLTGRSLAARLPALVRRSFALAWAVDRRSTIALLACQVISGLLEALGLFATTAALSALIQSAHDLANLVAALPSVAVLAGAAGLRAVLGIAIQALSNRLGPRISREAEYRMLHAATGAEMAAYDHPGFNDRYDKADRGVEVSRDMIGQSQNLVSSAATLAAAAVVVAALAPILLPLLVLTAVPQALASVAGERVTYLATLRTFHDRRMLSMLRWHLSHKEQADQIRTDTLAPYLLDKYRASGARVDRTVDEAAWQRAKISLLGSAVSGLAAALMWAGVMVLLGTGAIGAAVAGTLVFALRSAAGGLHGIVGYGTDLMRTGRYLDDWEEFIAEAGGQRLDRGSIVPGRPRHVALHQVTYRYPEADQDTLHEVDFEVRQGEIVAVVGENGSGKTTLMKLLSGLNLPTAGVVTWDGVSTRDLDPHALWRQCAVVPQEFARWPMTARENITLGQPRPEADDAVRRAAVTSGADAVIAVLRSGLNTLLAREWWGGVALSSGQWQRIAGARAIHRDAGLLVMDEPTSDLDARAEHRIFTGLRELAKDRAVVLVTHNLSNTMVADRIVVMEAGRVIDRGTFTELTARPGLFRDLWLLQRDRVNPHSQEKA